jgi:hypothetical protein
MAPPAPPVPPALDDEEVVNSRSSGLQATARRAAATRRGSRGGRIATVILKVKMGWRARGATEAAPGQAFRGGWRVEAPGPPGGYLVRA